MNPSDGGIMMPRVPPTATSPAEKRGGYSSLLRPETVAEPIAAAEPTL
jgi:hypothetical protein